MPDKKANGGAGRLALAMRRVYQERVNLVRKTINSRSAKGPTS